MPCIETRPGGHRRGPRLHLGLGLGLTVWLVAACAPTRPPMAPPSPPVQAPAPASPRPSAPPRPVEPVASDWRDYHRLAAQRLVRANPERSYLGPVQQPLKGIPVLEVELNGDGSIRDIAVQRRPRPADAQHTTQLAIDAVRRAAPFPPVWHLPRPWKYTEVFLFDDADRFKPRTLDD